VQHKGRARLLAARDGRMGGGEGGGKEEEEDKMPCHSAEDPLSLSRASADFRDAGSCDVTAQQRPPSRGDFAPR